MTTDPIMTAAQRVLELINGQPRTPSVDEVAVAIKNALTAGPTQVFVGPGSFTRGFDPGSLPVGRTVQELAQQLLDYQDAGGCIVRHANSRWVGGGNPHGYPGGRGVCSDAGGGSSG